MKPKRADREYLEFNPFDGDRDVDIRCHSVRLVTTRAEHHCAASDLSFASDEPHSIPSGTRVWKESALVDSAWGSCYCCFACLDRMLDELHGDDDPDSHAYVSHRLSTERPAAGGK